MTWGCSRTPQPGHHPPHTPPSASWTPRSRRGAGACCGGGGGMGLSHCPHCRRAAASRLLQSCSPALQRDSAQLHPAPSPFLQPRRGGHTLLTFPPPSPWPLSPPEPPPRPLFPPNPIHSHHRLLPQPQRRQGPPSRAELGLAAMGSGGCQPACTRASLPSLGQETGSALDSAPWGSPGSRFGGAERPCLLPGTGRKDLVVFPMGRDQRRCLGHMGESWDF